MDISASYPHIAARLFNTPLLMMASKLETVVGALHDHPTMRAPVSSETPRNLRNLDSTAIIPIVGSMVHRSGYLDAASGLQSYQGVADMLDTALNHDGVKRVVLDIDTPGGEVAGAFQLAAKIRAARDRKPVVAAVNELAASAGYLLASAATEVVVAETGYTGSIGVVTAHVDYSKAIDKKGLVVTHMYAGAHKIDGTPYQPLPDGVKADIQGELENIYDLFAATVASNRGLSVQKVKDTEACVYLGAAGKSVGLVDRIATLDEIVIGKTSRPANRTTASHSTLNALQTEGDLDVNEPEDKVASIVANYRAASGHVGAKEQARRAKGERDNMDPDTRWANLTPEQRVNAARLARVSRGLVSRRQAL
ncbi:MAG: S49 family peptidase [Gammaproteobacteria bacterium]